MKSINDVLLNPVRMRIIQEMAVCQSMTAADLCDKIGDVPRTTMYRHIKILIDNKILSVVSEQKVRGSVERTLALNIQEISRHNTLESASQNAFGFMMNKYAKLHNYFSSENPNPGKDKIFLNNTVMMMNDDEFDQFLSDLRGLLLKYSFEYASGRKSRDISVISSPADNE